MAATVTHTKERRPVTADVLHFQPQPQKNLQKNMAPPKPGVAWYLLAVSSFMTTIYAIVFLSGRWVWDDPAETKRILSLPASVRHIAFSILTIAVGPMQFLDFVRIKWPQVHVWLGRVYSFGVLGGGLFALKASWTVNTLPIGHYFFLHTTLWWLSSITLAMRAIWRKDVVTHKRWMTRNYILTYSAATIRMHVGFFMGIGLPEREALTISSLTCWIPIMIATEVWWRAKDRKMAVA